MDPKKGTLPMMIAAALLIPIGAGATPANSDPEHTTPASDAVAAVVNAAAHGYFTAAPQGVGLSVGVLVDGRSYTFNYGGVTRGSTTAPTSKSIYRIASITKTFTGTLLAQAVVDKKASLGDDVRDYLPGSYPNLAYEGQPICLGDLVDHVSGLPFNLPDVAGNRPPFEPMTPDTRKMLAHYTRQDFLSDLHHVVLTRKPGVSFSYSNAAVVLAAIVLERIYGQSYDDLVKARIAEPLGMVDTTNRLSRSQRRRILTGYDETGVVPTQSSLSIGAGDLYSTVDDMLQYARWQMDGTDDAVRLSQTPRFSPMEKYSVGLNWQMIHSGEHRRIWQEGEVPGFASMCMMFPDLKLAVVVFANELDRKSAAALSAMAEQIASGLDPAASQTKP